MRPSNINCNSKSIGFGIPLSLLLLNALIPVNLALTQAVATSVFSALGEGASGSIVSMSAGTMVGAAIINLIRKYHWTIALNVCSMLGAFAALILAIFSLNWHGGMLANCSTFVFGMLGVPLSVSVGGAFYELVENNKLLKAQRVQTIFAVAASSMAPISAGLLAAHGGAVAVLLAIALFYVLMIIIGRTFTQASTWSLRAPLIATSIPRGAKMILLVLVVDAFIMQWFIAMIMNHVTNAQWSPSGIGAILSIMNMGAVIGGGLFSLPKKKKSLWMIFLLVVSVVPVLLRSALLSLVSLDQYVFGAVVLILGVVMGAGVLIVNVLRYQMVSEREYPIFQKIYFRSNVMAMFAGSVAAHVSLMYFDVKHSNLLFFVVGGISTVVVLFLCRPPLEVVGN